MGRLRKEIQTHNAPDLPDHTARKLSGKSYDDLEAFTVDAWKQALKRYLHVKFGNDVEAQLRTVNKILKHKERLSRFEVLAARLVLEELNGRQQDGE